MNRKVNLTVIAVMLILFMAFSVFLYSRSYDKKLETTNTITTQLIIVNSNGDLLFNNNVEILEGETVKNQIEKSGVIHDKSPGYITTIFNIESSKSSGWVYEVNDKEVTVGYDQYKLKDNDKVIWKFIEW